MDSGIVILLLLAGLGVWLLSRLAKALRIGVPPKTYITLAVLLIIGILLLYANAQQ